MVYIKKCQRFPNKQKQLHNIYTMSAQRLRRWSDIV